MSSNQEDAKEFVAIEMESKEADTKQDNVQESSNNTEQSVEQNNEVMPTPTPSSQPTSNDVQEETKEKVTSIEAIEAEVPIDTTVTVKRTSVASKEEVICTDERHLEARVKRRDFFERYLKEELDDPNTTYSRRQYLELIRHGDFSNVPFAPDMAFSSEFIDIPTSTDTIVDNLISIKDLVGATVSYFMYLLAYSMRLRQLDDINSNRDPGKGLLYLATLPLLMYFFLVIHRLEMTSRQVLYYEYFKKGIIINFQDRVWYKSRVPWVIVCQAIVICIYGLYLSGRYTNGFDIALVTFCLSCSNSLYSYAKDTFDYESRLITLNQAINKTQFVVTKQRTRTGSHVVVEAELDALLYIKKCRIITDLKLRWILFNKYIDSNRFETANKEAIKKLPLFDAAAHKKQWEEILHTQGWVDGLDYSSILTYSNHLESSPELQQATWLSYQFRLIPFLSFCMFYGKFMINNPKIAKLKLYMWICVLSGIATAVLIELYGYYKVDRATLPA